MSRLTSATVVVVVVFIVDALSDAGVVGDSRGWDAMATITYLYWLYAFFRHPSPPR